MEKITGATFMKSALTIALNDMWSLATDPGRAKLLIFATDGQPTTGQNPCALRQAYEDANIEIAAVGIGANVDRSTLDCLTDHVTLSPNFGDFAASFGAAFLESLCRAAALTLYNGR
jgi:uncharacterized protein YegL